jgi:hypothetical protein
LQNPHFQKAKENLFPGEKVPLSRRRERVDFWMMDSATSPFGSAQNDRVGSMLVGVKVLGL